MEKPSEQLLSDIKRCGSVIVQGTVPEAEVWLPPRECPSKEKADIQALQWLEDIKAYIQLNTSVKGFPADDKQVFEL